MKSKSYFIILLLFAMFTSCNDLSEMDLLDDPKSIKPNQTNIELLNSSIQLSFKDFQYELHLIADGIVRYTSLNAFSYQDALRAEVGDKVWNVAYSEFLPDAELLISIAQDKGLYIYEGRVKILKSYVLTTLVDFFGDIPVIERAPDLTFSPELVEGSLVYDKANQLLSEAIELLSEEGIEPETDLYYEGNNENWVKLAWTLKLRNALYTSRIRNNLDVIFDIVHYEDLIESNDESFLFRYGKERDAPPSRHPLYEEYYGNGSREYLGNYFMWTIIGEKRNGTGSRIYDPRSGLYVYRQFWNIKDLEAEGVLCYNETYSQDLEIPDHYSLIDPNLPYCVASLYGYYGRDHGNG
ncbi:MAG: SusD/RagB family nutrient-binding outer membrane lipoprotein, partial [Saprospiraceae bacterium]|nr:SusD/RagB family nutrient-binding outer membrane lipoprotein [Saprospiraceae bacterium]